MKSLKIVNLPFRRIKSILDERPKISVQARQIIKCFNVTDERMLLIKNGLRSIRIKICHIYYRCSSFFLPIVLFSESAAGPSSESPAGDEVGGAGGDIIGVGELASAVGADTLGAGAGDVSGAGHGVGEGAFLNNSIRRSILSTVKMHNGVEAITVEATMPT
ncbi:hypothetical protein FXO37_34547 [Capsicum annuum]|nr:hypothetical protein FXO37_34547 [Capsicum annuum]